MFVTRKDKCPKHDILTVAYAALNFVRFTVLLLQLLLLLLVLFWYWLDSNPFKNEVLHRRNLHFRWIYIWIMDHEHDDMFINIWTMVPFLERNHRNIRRPCNEHFGSRLSFVLCISCFYSFVFTTLDHRWQSRIVSCGCWLQTETKYFHSLSLRSSLPPSLSISLNMIRDEHKVNTVTSTGTWIRREQVLEKPFSVLLHYIHREIQFDIFPNTFWILHGVDTVTAVKVPVSPERLLTSIIWKS